MLVGSSRSQSGSILLLAALGMMVWVYLTIYLVGYRHGQLSALKQAYKVYKQQVPWECN